MDVELREIQQPDLDTSATTGSMDTAIRESPPKRVRFAINDSPRNSKMPTSKAEIVLDAEGKDGYSTQSIEDHEPGNEITEPGEDEDEEPREPRYMYSSFGDVENIEGYQVGGYHPITIGDRFGGQYIIIHKLGYGGFGTVWLARDTEKQRFVALKIIMAEHSKGAVKKDLEMLKYLAEHVERPGGNFIDIPIEDFWITGPNGKHICIVSEVAGPSIAHLTRAYCTKIEPEDTRRMALQITQCLAFLHSEKVGVAHGDLTTSNVLLEIGNLDSLSQQELLKLLGEPVAEKVKPYTDETLEPGAPEFIYQPADLRKLSKFFTGNIVIIDFGASFFLDNPLEDCGTPAQFSSPELIFERQNGMFSDVWALACTIFEMRASEPLFESFVFGEGDVLRSMIGILGQLPEKYTDMEERKWLKDIEGSGDELDKMVFAIKGISEDEKITLYDLLRQVLTYNVEERLAVEEMLRHPWFSYNLHRKVEAKRQGGGNPTSA